MEDNDAQARGVWPDLEVLALRARQRRRLPPETRSAIILQLCRRAALSVKDLSVLLDRSEAYIGDAIRPLVSGGDLTFLYPDQPRHPKQKYLTAGATPAGPAPAPVPSPRPTPAPAPALMGGPAPAFPRPEPAREAGPVSAPTSAPAPASDEPSDAKARFPLQAVNTILVIAIGIILARQAVTTWPIYAAIAAMLLAAAHVVTRSRQFEQFRVLHGKRNRTPIFVLLKGAVAVAEIAIVYFMTNAFWSNP